MTIRDKKLVDMFIQFILDNYSFKFSDLDVYTQSVLRMMVLCNTTKDINEYIQLNLKGKL